MSFHDEPGDWSEDSHDERQTSDDEHLLDARLRGAYARQYDDVRRRVGDRAFTPDAIAAGPKTSTRVLAAAAAVLVLVMGAAAASRVFGSPETGSVETGPSAADDALAESTQPSNTVETPSEDDSSPGDDGSADEETTEQRQTTTSTVAPDDDVDDFDDTVTTDTTVPETSAATGTIFGSVEQTTSTTLPPNLSYGVPNDVCPSGARAELEWAALQYVGTTRGWGRMEDLVDEQDGPFYFEGWEPGFTEPVSVQLILDEPVFATEVRVAQDPENPVSGTISIEAISAHELELSGTGGWQVLSFDEPLLLDSLTIERSAEESNVMELIVCVEPG